MRTFDPWIGSKFTAPGIGGVRVLILGEAHYGDPADEYAGFTIDIIKKCAQTERFRFFTVTQKLISGNDGYISDQSRKDFWEHVAFYNFVQRCPGLHPRIRPTEQMWTDAKEPFIEVVGQLRPDIIITLGKELERHLPIVQASPRLCHIPHPSSFGFNQRRWMAVIQSHLEQARTSIQPNKSL